MDVKKLMFTEKYNGILQNWICGSYPQIAFAAINALFKFTAAWLLPFG